ncbi:hypothetical protein C6N75_12210 [Streptomyces solincola]|uniref:Uncharacterized protein n=1 Tax=Streptomyces solincola TaxID=2100817 RepID=A0A2S9PX22_9ACTN|nr:MULTISPECIES: hypothetical protein [Streptomyces]PRH78955.1 hypothetical protein C6N75_12210 [Streptomyces solincola]
MSAHPAQPPSFEVLIVPAPEEGRDPGRLAEVAVRTAVVRATGELGASGFPRYAGGGLEADIDPATPAVEALLVDGEELDYGLVARVR